MIWFPKKQIFSEKIFYIGLISVYNGNSILNISKWRITKEEVR